uniref:DNA-directed RNA polymerase subunit n=1 Tax=Noccaea caerulescens TaxID=107243 RepID=A0A1J3E5A1_NOCCA
MEGLKLSDAELMVYIHPSQSRNVYKAICRQLSSLLFQYDETFDGVLLAYDLTVGSKQAKILAGLAPYFGVRVNTKLLLFDPKPNSLVEGKILKVSLESIHVVVLGFSAAVITDVDIREEFKYRMKDGEGRFVSRSDKGHVLKVGTMLRLQVQSFDAEVMHIAGSLLPANTGCVKWLEKKNGEALHMDRDRKRRKLA